MREIFVTGRLVSDAEVKTTMNGKSYLYMRIANSEGPNDTTHYFDVESFDPRYINNFKPYLTKGSAVDIVGELRAKAFIKQNGKADIDLRILTNTIKFHRLYTEKQEEVQIVDGTAVNQDVEVPEESLPF